MLMLINTQKWQPTFAKLVEAHLWDDEGGWYIRGLTKMATDQTAQLKVVCTLSQTLQRFYLARYLKSAWRESDDAVDELILEYGLHLNSQFATPNDDIGFVTRVYKALKRTALSREPQQA